MSGNAEPEPWGPTPDVHAVVDDAILRLTIDRPHRRNAVTTALLTTLGDLFERAAGDADIRVVQLSGSGSVFCAGADHAEFAAPAPGVDRAPVRDSSRLAAAGRLIRLVRSCPVPVLAALNGPAVGFGASLALACDIIVGSTSSRLDFSFTRLGLMPDGAGHLLLMSAVGRTETDRLILTGASLSAVEAHRLRIIAEVTDPEDLPRLMQWWAANLGSAATAALRHSKQASNNVLMPLLEQALDYEMRAQSTLLTSHDYLEAQAARRESRNPHFLGR